MTDKETMIHVYEAEIEVLQTENSQLKAQVEFLKEQLAYKTFGKPLIKLYYFLGLLKHFIQIEQNEIYEKKLYSR